MDNYVAYRSDKDVVWVAVGFRCAAISNVMTFLVTVEALDVLQPLLVFGLRFGTQIRSRFPILLLVLLGLCCSFFLGRLVVV